MPNDTNAAEAGDLTLHLLDSAQWLPLQTWRFTARKSVCIGRGTENDITVTDPQVSRCHVRLEWSGGGWKLVSLGRNGTRVNSQVVSELPLTHRLMFQLGVNGPLFRFLTAEESADHLPTCSPSVPGSLDFLSVDETRKHEEVEQIAGGDAFKNMQQQARELKERRLREERDGVRAHLAGPRDP